MTWTTDDYQFMSRAIHLAKRGWYTCDPNPRVGCVIVKDGRIISEGWHAKAGEAHAEINALIKNDIPEQTSVYITLEPCSHQGRTPPCTDALIKAKAKEVIIAMIDPNPAVSGQGIKQLQDAGITVREGLQESEAINLNPGFIKRMAKGLPHITIKQAMSIDGRTALANGESQWISSEESRKDVHKLRAGSSAIVTTAETIIKDDPQLNVRDFELDYKQPVRIIIDRQLKTPKQARLFQVQGKVIIYTTQKNNNEYEGLDVDVVVIPDSGNWLYDVFKHMADEYEINNVITEAGSTFNGSLVDEGLVDEFIIYVAPKLLGHDAQSLINIEEIQSLSNAKELHIDDVRRIGSDIRLRLTVQI